MAKKQTRRSISVSRSTYERLKSFCETNGISMSQFVENRVGDFLGEGAAIPETTQVVVERAERPASPLAPRPAPSHPSPAAPRPLTPSLPPKSSSAPPVTPIAPRPSTPTGPAPMTSAAARYAVEPPPPIIKKTDQPAPKAPAMPKANEIFTF
jgi:hypothetical protein